MIASIGTYVPVWGTPGRRAAGEDEDAVTMAVEAGRLALEAAPRRAQVGQVVLVTRDLPLLEGGSGAALLAGLGLEAATAIREEVGGSPAVMDALLTAAEGTLVIGADVAGGAGAAAALTGDAGAELRLLGRSNRSLPVTARDTRGSVHNYGDPRLLRELGYRESVARLGLEGTFDAVAGLDARASDAVAGAAVPPLPSQGASSALFALAELAEEQGKGQLLAVEQANVVACELSGGPLPVAREQRAAQKPIQLQPGAAAEISISLAAYERAFDAKLRLEGTRCESCATLAYPRRFRCTSCGCEGLTSQVALPRQAEVYSLATVHVPVPGLSTPYTVVLVNLGDTGLRLLARLTGAPPGSVSIGDRGQMVFRRVAVRSGVPDYGYAFLPALAGVATEAGGQR